MTEVKYVVANQKALEEAIASEKSPELRAVMHLIGASPESYRGDLIRQLNAVRPGLQDKHPFACEGRVDAALRTLVREGAVQKKVIRGYTAEDFAVKFGLTRTQFNNYYSGWLVRAGIFPAATNRKKMSYPSEVADVFNAAKPFYQSGTPYSKALSVGVGAVLGDEKKRQFEQWHRRQEEQVLSEKKQKVRSRIASQLASSGKMPLETSFKIRYDVLREALANGRADAAKNKESLEEILWKHWVEAGHYQAVVSYPMNLYLALKYEDMFIFSVEGKDGKGRRIFRKAALPLVKAAMDASPLTETFEGYEKSVHAMISESVKYMSEIIRAPIQGALDSVVEHERIRSGNDDYKTRKSANAALGNLEILKARYVTGGRVRTLEEVKQEYGRTIERTRQRKAKALNLLRRLPEVKALLDRNLPEEWKAFLNYARSL